MDAAVYTFLGALIGALASIGTVYVQQTQQSPPLPCISLCGYDRVISRSLLLGLLIAHCCRAPLIPLSDLAGPLLSRGLADGFLRQPTGRVEAQKSWLNQTYSDEDLRRFLSARGLKSEDNGKKSGGLWVFVDGNDPDVASQLRTWGFQLKAGRGWWRK